MVAWKLKILWLFLTVLQKGCVVKSEENEFESNVRNLDPESNHFITDELTATNGSILGNNKESKLNNVNTHYENPRRYNRTFDDGVKHLNNAHDNEDARDLNFHTDNIKKDFDKPRYQENFMHHVKRLNGTPINFTKLDTFDSSTSPTNEDLEFHLNHDPEFGLHINSTTSTKQNNAESTPAENEEHKEISEQTTTDWRIEQENLYTTKIYDSISKSRKYLFSSEYHSDQNQKLEKSTRENWKTGGESNGFTTIDDLESSNIKKEENVNPRELLTESSDLDLTGVPSSEHGGGLLDIIFNKLNFTLNNNTEENEYKAEITKYSREIDSQIVSNSDGSVEDDVEGSGDDFDDRTNDEQSFNTEASDTDGQETFNTTVEDIFSSADSDFKYPEPEINSTSPKNDIIERWLTTENESFTLHNSNLSNKKPLPFYIDFDANYTGYDYNSRSVDNEETKHNLSETEGDSKLNFPIPEQSNTERQILLEEDSLNNTTNPDDADDVDMKHSSPAQELETASPKYAKIQSVLRDLNQNDEFSQTNNFKDTFFINNTNFQVENNKSTIEQPTTMLSSNLHNALNETEFKSKVVDYELNSPVQVSEEELTTISPELVTTTKNVLLANDEDFSDTLLSNDTRNLQNKLMNQYSERSKTLISNNSVKPQENSNKSFVQAEDFHDSPFELAAAQTEIYHQNISELNVENEGNLLNIDAKSSNTSMSPLKLNEQSITNDLGKTSNDDGATESQIFKPIVPMFPEETSNPSSTQTSTPSEFADTNLDEIIFNEKSTETNKFPLGDQKAKLSSTHATASVSRTLSMSNHQIKERISGKQFPGSNNAAESSIFIEKEKLPNMDLLENERNFNITTESRMALLEDNDEINIFPVTQKPVEVISDYSSFYGKVNTEDGTVCASLILTIKILVNNTRIHLPGKISVVENYKLQHTDIFWRWEAADHLYNISTSFHVRCENGYCSMDGIHVTITKRTNTDIFQDDVEIGESMKAQAKNLKFFKTELGTLYQNNAETILSLEGGIKIYLANVEFLVAKDSCLSNRKGVKSESLLADYHTELIGGSVGILLLGGIALFTFKMLRKANESFKPTIG